MEFLVKHLKAGFVGTVLVFFIVGVSDLYTTIKETHKIVKQEAEARREREETQIRQGVKKY